MPKPMTFSLISRFMSPRNDWLIIAMSCSSKFWKLSKLSNTFSLAMSFLDQQECVCELCTISMTSPLRVSWRHWQIKAFKEKDPRSGLSLVGVSCWLCGYFLKANSPKFLPENYFLPGHWGAPLITLNIGHLIVLLIGSFIKIRSHCDVYSC